MKEVVLNKHKIKFYNAIEELPISRFHKYSKYMLVEGGVGDSLADIDAHIGKILQLMPIDMAKAQRELLNLRQNLYMVTNEIDLHNKGFMCLVYSVNGKVWEDFSDEGVDKLYRMICDTPIGNMEEVVLDIRGKIDHELKAYFPDMFNDATEKNYLDNLRRRALLQVREITTGESQKEGIDKLTEQIMLHCSPKVFEGRENAEVTFDRKFEEMCLVLSKEFGVKAKELSVMEFYSAYDKLEKMSKEMEKKLKNKR